MSRLLLRVDADTEIGSGHFMRCLALARAWINLGGRAGFVTRCGSRSLLARATESGARVAVLERSHPHGSDLDSILRALRDHAREGDVPWLVTDGYFFTPSYHAAIRDAGFPLLIVDDTAHLGHYHASVVLNQNVVGDSIEYRCDPDTRLLRGPRFALLQPEFGHLPRTEKAGGTLHLLVTMGGGDPHNVTKRVLAAIEELQGMNIRCTVVAGPANPHITELARIVERIQSPVVTARLTVDVQDMAGLIGSADLAISAAGSTCWELACAGVPTVVLITAANQMRLAGALTEAGVAVNLGWHHKTAIHEIVQALRRLANDSVGREQMKRNGRRLVDGRGAERVARFLRLRRRTGWMPVAGRA